MKISLARKIVSREVLFWPEAFGKFLLKRVGIYLITYSLQVLQRPQYPHPAQRAPKQMVKVTVQC